MEIWGVVEFRYENISIYFLLPFGAFILFISVWSCLDPVKNKLLDFNFSKGDGKIRELLAIMLCMSPLVR